MRECRIWPCTLFGSAPAWTNQVACDVGRHLQLTNGNPSFFLRKTPKPTRDEWRKAQYWMECLPELRTAYRHICAYCCLWLTLEASVDHYLPKSVFQQQ